jgi:hypothetical protein
MNQKREREREKKEKISFSWLENYFQLKFTIDKSKEKREKGKLKKNEMSRNN